MVTAILIPIILIYFYIVSKRDRKKYEEKWSSLTKVREEATIKGRIVHKSEEKQRFYYHKFIFVTECKIKTSTTTITAKIIQPLTESFIAPIINVGDEIKCTGEWKKDYFQISNYEIITSKN